MSLQTSNFSLLLRHCFRAYGGRVWLLLAFVWVVGSGWALAQDPPAAPKLSAAQQQRLRERDRYAQETKKLRKEGKLAEALAACEKMLAIEREVLGNVHKDVAGSLEQLAEMQEELEDFAAARKARQEVLAIQTKVHGDKDWRVTDARLALSEVERLSQCTADERRQRQRAKRLAEKVEQLYGQGRYREAADLGREGLALCRNVLGPMHPDTATSLNNLGDSLRAQANYAAARPYLEQALAIRQKALGPEHPHTATSLHNLGSLLHDQGDYAAARPYLERALAIRQKAHGSEHPFTAITLNNLGGLLWEQGDHAAARPYLEQALAIRQKALGPEHPFTATSLHNLGSLLYYQGDYAAARPCYERALAIRQKALGPEHPFTAITLNSLGVLLLAQGDYAAARPYYEQALAIRQKVRGPAHPDTAVSLNNLGSLLKAQGEYAAARPYYEQALAIRQKVLGPAHPDTAKYLNNLGGLLYAHGEYAAARPYYEQALAIRQKVLGPAHPDTAESLNNLGALLQVQGEYAAARPYLEQALAISQKVLGPAHRNTARSLHNLGGLLYAHGEYAAARPYYEQALAIAGKNLELASAAQSERQQLAMTRSLRYHLDGYVTLAPLAGGAGEPVYRHVVTWKGAVLARQRRLRLERQRPELAADLAKYHAVANQLATLAFAVPGARQQEYRRKIEELTVEKDRLESDLARRSREFQQQKAVSQLTAAHLLALLPADAALVDFLEYNHYSPPTEAEGKWKWQRRLVAFVVRADRPVVQLDLGSAQEIAQAVDAWRAVVKAAQPATAPTGPAETLRQRLWRPLTKHLDGVKTVLVSPDGALTGLPFAALPGPKPGTYPAGRGEARRRAGAAAAARVARPARQRHGPGPGARAPAGRRCGFWCRSGFGRGGGYPPRGGPRQSHGSAAGVAAAGQHARRDCNGQGLVPAPLSRGPGAGATGPRGHGSRSAAAGTPASVPALGHPRLLRAAGTPLRPGPSLALDLPAAARAPGRGLGGDAPRRAAGAAGPALTAG
jgi:tetratricopeptide (TPR) repeat protein